ncbi:amidohydrolase family protein [Gracilibacillus lacisalsi]|uniref:amidohydrolase family protein n=1 Tax=Gracilibacillus lacisalsi TaxID=393087 RepID=UPI00036C6EB0|nr:amidohydrolase family protein [Gracilibacillus lacisalsi]
MAQTLTLYNVQLPLIDKSKRYKITIKEGKYRSIDMQPEHIDQTLTPFKQALQDLPNCSQIDLEGRIVLPSFVDIHTHLDKAFSLQAVPNKTGTLFEAIRNYSERAHLFTKEEIKQRVRREAIQSLSFGTTHIRSHVNFEMDTSVQLAIDNLQAVIEVKEELKDFIDIQIVPMFSKLIQRTDQEFAVIEEAIQLGVDGIGGAPHLIDFPAENIEIAMQLAIKHGKFVDLHVDENDDPAVCTIEELISKTAKYQLEGYVTAGHLCSLAAMEQMKADHIMEGIRRHQIHAVTLPGANMYLQGRQDSGIIRRGVTRIKELIDHGVSIATASDNVNDPFHPFGCGDMVQIGLLTAYAAHLASEEELLHVLKMMTTIPGRIYGLEHHNTKENAPANFVMTDAKDIYELFGTIAPTRYVFTKNRWLNGVKTEMMMSDKKLEALWNKTTEDSSLPI